MANLPNSSGGGAITDGQDVNLLMEVINCWWLSVRDAPSVSGGNQVTTIRGPKSGTPAQVTATKEKNGWYYHDGGGWSSGKYLKTLEDKTPYQEASEPTSKPEGNQTPEDAGIVEDNDAEEYLRDIDFSTSSIGQTYSYNDVVKDMSGIFGAPFSFINKTDPPLFSGGLGYYYTTHTLTDMPLLLLTPGKPEFLKGLSKKSKKDLATFMTDITGDISNSALEKKVSELSTILDGKTARYYEFKYQSTEYYNYVNRLCNASASYLGLSNRRYKGRRLGEFDWGANYNKELDKLDIAGHNIPFFINASATNISESLSNSTGKSMLDSKLGGVSELAKEFSFMFQSMTGDDIDDALSKKYNEKFNDIDSLVDGNPNSIFSKLGGGMATIASSGNLVFPNIWKSSSKSESYSINVKLSSPYGDPYSIYLHVFVPFFHLLALVAPRSISNNGVITPFMVRAYCRGYFNCDMGMFESMSFQKGKNGWSSDGLPLDIDVTLNLKNLYDSFAISHNPITFINNVTLIDFLATMSGVNINKPEVRRKLDVYASVFAGSARSKFMNPFERTHENITQRINDFFK